MATLDHRIPPPTAQDAAIATKSAQTLSRCTKRAAPLLLRVTDAEQEARPPAPGRC